MSGDGMDLCIVDYLDHRPEPVQIRDFCSLYKRNEVSLDLLGMDVWRYHILLYCDLMALLRLNWVNRRLRQVLNTAEFVVEYQSVCWYLVPRYCRCPRNIFYLNLSEFLDFSYDYAGIPESGTLREVYTVQDASMVLRHFGRTPDMLVQSFQRAGNPPTRPPLTTRFLDPRASTAFKDGFTKMWIDTCIVPMPRCIDHPVEQRRVRPAQRTTNERLATETMAEFEHRVFWREFHEVTNDMVYEVEVGRDPMAVAPPGYPEPRTVHGFDAPEPDLLEEWMQYCASVGVDPYDPSHDDAECRGFRCIRWAREKMHDSAVGGTAYPLELCLHREDLTRTAARLGTDYLDRMYVHLNRYHGGEPDWNTMEHRGVLYFMGLRYEHCNEDFAVWALHTQAMLHAVYAHMWLDALSHWTRMLMYHLHQLASDVESDMRFTVLQERWKFLHSLCFAGPAVMAQTRHYGDRQRKRDQAAIHLIFNSHYLEENRYLSSLVDHGSLWTNEGDTASRSRHYLTSLLEQYDHRSPNFRTESQRIQDAYRLARFAEYVTDFAEYVAPRVDDRTCVTRRRALSIYLSSFVSLTLFSPGWKRTYHWKPSRTHEMTHWHIPRVNPQHNHRFQRYLDYCNRRTLFYHPDPSLLLRNDRDDATHGWRG